MTDLCRAGGLRAYSGGTVPDFDRIVYSPLKKRHSKGLI